MNARPVVGAVYGAIFIPAAILSAVEVSGLVKTKEQQAGIDAFFDLVVLPSILVGSAAFGVSVIANAIKRSASG